MQDSADISELYQLLATVSQASEVGIDLIIGRSRRLDNALIPRQMFCYIAREKKKWTDLQIGTAIKHKRVTVFHSHKVVKTMLEEKVKDPKYVALAKRLGILEENKL